MEHPRVVAKRPDVRELEPGTYHYCTCGLSQNQPFCDGGHAGSSFRPHTFTVEETCRMALCLCKHSKENQCCDGSHRMVMEEGEER